MDVPRLIRTHVTTGDLNPPQELITALNDGSVALSEIVKSLGEYLTSTEDDVRLKGLTFLANTVPLITPNKINRAATQTLTSFFLAKLDDFDALPPSLQALTVLSKLPTFDDSAAVEVYQGLVEQVNLKAYVQATRHLAYVLIDSILALHRKALKDLGANFLNSYTKLVDGEKDPRNLMLLFSIDRVILLEFDVANHMEDMFDITFCYFPIMFKPPPNDPYGITADDLKLALRNCMAASPGFAKMAQPLFLEKFATVTGHAMKDLLLSMAACFPVYGPQAVSERGTELWEGIKTEIMYSSDLTIEAAAVSALESLVHTLYPTAAVAPTGLAHDIIKQALDAMSEPEKSQALAATKIIAALVRASPSVGTFALSQAFPQLFRQFNQPALPSHRSPILSAISSLIYAARTVYGAANPTRQQEDEKSLQPFRTNLMDVLREGLRTNDLRVPAIKGSVSLIEIPAFLHRDEVEDLVKGLNDVLVNDENPETLEAVINGLTSVSKVHPAIIEGVTLPLLFHNLPERAPGLANTKEWEQYRSILGSLKQLCIQPALFETLIVRITTKLDLLATPSAGHNDDPMSDTKETDEEKRETEVAFAWDLLNCLSGVIDAKLKDKHVDVAKHFDRIIPRLYGLFITAATTNGKIEPLFRDPRLLNIVGKITETLMWELSVERQSQQLAAVYAAFERGEWDGITQAPADVKLTDKSPLRSGATSSERNLIAIYSSTIQGAKATCADPSTSAEIFLSSKIRWTIYDATDAFQVRWALDLITAYVNKRDRELQSALNNILEAIWVKEVVDTEQGLETRRRALHVYQHVVKALSLIRHPLAYTAVERVIAILKFSNLDPVFVNEAARSFGILAEGKGKGVSKTSHLTSKLLFAQKLWNHILPRLLEGDQEAIGRGRLPYLVAFASLLPLVPASLCISELSTILPLLIRSLSLSDPTQRINSITTLISILETQNLTTEVDSLLHQQASVIVDGLVKCFLPEDPIVETSGKVRATALRCLAVIPEAIRFDSLRNQKSAVVRDLGKALDDPLRSVRKEAVECRARWFRYGTSTA